MMEEVSLVVVLGKYNYGLMIKEYVTYFSNISTTFNTDNTPFSDISNIPCFMDWSDKTLSSANTVLSEAFFE